MHFFLSRRFLPLFVTQFLGAFNDNFLKNALVVLITYRLAVQTGENAQGLVAIAAALFILPYFLFSATAGQLADKIERTKIARAVKLVEINLMLLAAVGFHWGNSWFLMAVLFGMGTHSTFFSPVKYALLPQHLGDRELLPGNACIEAGTFLAILFGTISGGLLILGPSGELAASLTLLAAALIGYGAARYIPSAPAPVPQLKISWNIFRETARLVAYSRSKPGIFHCILAISWFWFIGATFLAQLPVYTKQVLYADETVVTFFLTLFSVGIAAGSFLCNRLLKGKIKLTWMFLSVLGMGLCAVDLAFASFDLGLPETGLLLHIDVFLQNLWSWRISADLFLLAVCGGVYIVPLNAYLQQFAEQDHLARLIATNNLINAVSMVGSSVFILVMLGAGITIPQTFMTVGAISILVAFGLRHFRF